MNLVQFSIKSKGTRNFARRLWTVFTRFGLSEAHTRRSLAAIMDTTNLYGAMPTFFVPAVVLQRHVSLFAELARRGAEIGVHGYVHNDYRSLSHGEQYKQTEQAIVVFDYAGIPRKGFRHPYLGWTEESVAVLTALDFIYDSNEAVLHDVIDLDSLPTHLRRGYEKSLQLFQAIPCTAYTLRPHYEGRLLRIPLSIPDDEMLYDRLRITDQARLGKIWSQVLRHVYDLGGVYVLNLHPERGLLCQRALDLLLSAASTQPLSVWMASLGEIAEWWQERRQFHLDIAPLAPNKWRVTAQCSPRSTLLARCVIVEDQPTTPWHGSDVRVQGTTCIINAPRRPCIGLSPRTPTEVDEWLHEQGYPLARGEGQDAESFAMYLDLPDGLGMTRHERIERCSTLVRQIEQSEVPLVRYGCWPNGSRAALAVSGDVDSVTVQDFFLRIREVRTATSTVAQMTSVAEGKDTYQLIQF